MNECSLCRNLLGKKSGESVEFHLEDQDTECDAWHALLDLVEKAAREQWSEFAPGKLLDPNHWQKIVTLPPSIAKLKKVKDLFLYGSHLVRLPPEIGEMEALERFTPYTSYRLHWFPFEITHCLKLKKSSVSTRAILWQLQAPSAISAASRAG